MATVGDLSRLLSAGMCRVISYDIDNTGQKLIFADIVLNHFNRNRQWTPQIPEAGGQLFVRFEGNSIQVEQATGPRATDRRSLLDFIPDRLAERREIKRLFRAGLHYVGDWHTHPEAYPRPSETDIDSLRDMFKKSRHKLASFLVVIVGTAVTPKGLFIGLCNNNGIVELHV